MGFIDHKPERRPFLQQGEESRGAQGLRGNIEEPDLSTANQLPPLTVGCFFETAVQGHRGDAQVVQGLYLIKHQGNEGGDDQGKTPQGKGRKLITEAFTAAGRQDRQDIPAIKYRLYNLPLARLEVRKTENGAK